MRTLRGLVFITISLLVPAYTYATEMQDEIRHLLEFVGNTQCKYERNGSSHSGPDAVNHIKTKYDYFKNGIDTTERFIELSATKSTMSGKFYMIHCEGKETIKSQQWLLQELERYRNARQSTHSSKNRP